MTALGSVGVASAYHDRYDTVVDVVDAGADDTGEEPVSDLLEGLIEDHRDGDIVLEFPPGRYRVDEQVFVRGFHHLGLVGDDATIVPDPADEYEGPARAFKLGTASAPGDWLEVRNLAFDFRAPNTGLRGIQAQVEDLWVSDVAFVGQHDTGTWGPTQFDVVNPDNYGLVENLRMPAGGEHPENTPQDATPAVGGLAGPTGMIVSPEHRGTLVVRDCEMGAFPGNGLYSSAYRGTVWVEGGTYKNSNVANVRLDGHGSRVRNATVVVDHSRPEDDAQVGIRLDDGTDFRVEDVEIRLPEATASAIRIDDEAEAATISDVTITMDDDRAEEAVFIESGAGPVTIERSAIEMRQGAQAVEIEAYDGDGSAPVELHGVTITGDAAGGYGGSHAIRCERDDCVFVDVVAEQPGDDYRRVLTVNGRNCRIEGGRYESTHHPIINNADGTEIRGIEARAYNGLEAVKLINDRENVGIYDSVLYEGIENHGTELETAGNEYPSS